MTQHSMSMPPPPLPAPGDQLLAPQTTQVPIADARTLLHSFTSFLTVSIHTILFYRGIYPEQTFLSAKAFNLPVHQSRHPKVCQWINDAVDAVMAQVAKGAVERVAVVIHSSPSASPETTAAPQQPSPGSVLERWMFDVSRFPSWPGGLEALRNFRGGEGEDLQRDDEDPGEDDNGSGNGDGNGNENPADAAATVENEPPMAINWVDVDEQLRGAVRRIAYGGEKMDALPEGCTFAVAVELREEAAAPIGHPQPWIPSQPGLQPGSQHRPERGRDVGGASTTPLRAVEAGPLFFECWVEEGKKTIRGAVSSSESQTSQFST